MIKNLVKFTAGITLCLMISGPALAQVTYTCGGVPRGLAMSANGSLVVEALGGLQWVILCNVEGAINSVTVSACKSLYASLLTAQVSARPFTLWFTNTAGSCAANTPWATAAGLYFWKFD